MERLYFIEGVHCNIVLVKIAQTLCLCASA
jgi:hypothetical protein